MKSIIFETVNHHLIYQVLDNADLNAIPRIGEKIYFREERQSISWIGYKVVDVKHYVYHKDHEHSVVVVMDSLL